jgi:hypothetical protein
LVLSLGLIPGQYTSLFADLLAAGDGCTMVAVAVATACKMVIEHLPWQ